MGTVDRKDVFLGNDLLGRTLGEYIPLFHNDDMVREPQGHIQIVKHHNDGLAVPVHQLSGGRHDLQLVAYIQETHRFIEQV